MDPDFQSQSKYPTRDQYQPQPQYQPQQQVQYQYQGYQQQPDQSQGVRRKRPGSLHVTFVLIAINVVVFIVTMFIPSGLYARLGLSVWSLRTGRWWTLFTSMFMHSGFDHIANNMITLFFLGTQLEGRLGRRRYLLLYLVSGVVAGLFFCAFAYLSGEYAYCVGASGAIFGLFGAFGFLIWRNHMLHGRNDGSLVTEIQLGIYIFMMGENILYGLMATNVANSAHVGGLISGFIIMRALVGNDLSGVNR